MMQLLRLHPGHHVDPATLSALHLFFRRALRLPWRKPAVPASHPEAGAAAGDGYPCCECCDGCGEVHGEPCEGGCNDPVLDDKWTWEVRAEQDAVRRARQHADAMHAGYARAVDRLRADAGLPTIEEIHAVEQDRATYVRSHMAETAQVTPELLERLRDGLRNLDAPVYGQAPQLEVEPELARRVIA